MQSGGGEGLVVGGETPITIIIMSLPKGVIDDGYKQVFIYPF